jgi:hypothetical protein
MSGNIKDTDVTKIRSCVTDLINDLEKTIENGEDIRDNEYLYEKKYKYLLDTSKNLYNMILDQYRLSKFNKQDFMRNLDMMLSAIENIQNARISQYDASKNVGESLASQFIPQLKK